jgi:ABC-type bacteriocin/lantibiotic exporter with double-glycine peptidase domain
MIALLFLNALMDLFGLATIGVLIQSALQGDFVTAEEYSRDLASSEAEFLFNSSLRWIYQEMNFVNEMQMLFFIAIVIFIIFLGKNAASLGILYLQARYSYNIALRLSKKMFQHYYNKGYLFISGKNTGDKIYQIFEIPMRFAGGYLFPFFNFSTDLFVIILIGIGLIAVNPFAVILLAVAIVPTFLGVYAFSKNRVQALGTAKNNFYPKAYASINEAMRAFVNVKLGNKENYILNKYDSVQTILNRLEAKLIGFYNKINQKTNDVVFGLGILVIFGYAYYSNQTKEDVLVLLGFFGVAVYKLLPAVNNMVGNLLGMKSYGYVTKELEPLVDIQLRPFDEVDAISFEDKIELKKIGFVYPDTDKQIIENFDLTINKGETIGIIGASGSGKTTLLKIILRLLRESTGSFVVDGKELTNENEDAAFQKIIGYVEQETFIAEGTLEENIAILEDEIDYDRLERAIKDAQLEDFVKNQPLGLKMQLGEAGIKLSGGQKQRVGIARALYKNPQILVLDEITSALDSATEKEIVKVINGLSGTGKTIIIVAHRMSTLSKADFLIKI